jgi:cytochrome c peroxidase
VIAARELWIALLLLHPASGAAAPPSSENPTTPEKVALGRQLFFDPRLSGDNTMSCATCHLPEKGFADGLPRARGAGGKVLQRNTQSLLNAGLYTAYFWDGRARTLEEQALAPVQAADEMNQDPARLRDELAAVPGYARQFRSVFGTPVTLDGIAQAIAAFERTLLTRNSPFQRYQEGGHAALSETALEGWRIFREAGCDRCHGGPALSDSRFYRIGTGYQDPGRGAVTGDLRLRYAFRTPSLWDVARTAPYMHDGSIRTLEEVVQFYFRSTPLRPPEGLTLDFEPLVDRSFSEIASIVAFLEALTGEAPQVAPPELP